MKTKNLLIVITLLIFSSCTRVLYTHNQVMDRYHTKEEIIARFGLPTEKRQGENIEEWIYDFGTISKGRGTGVGYRGISFSSGQYDNTQKFIKFTFDSNGKLLKWDSQSVDLTEKKVSTGKTIAGVIILLGLSIAAGIALGNSGATY
jgi:hypothetical protein